VAALRVAARPRKQVRRLEKIGRRTVVGGHPLPGSRAGRAAGIALPYVVSGCVGQGAQFGLSPVRLNNLDWLATAQPVLCRQPPWSAPTCSAAICFSRLELGTFGTAWRVIRDRFVDWRRYVRYSVHRALLIPSFEK
jgi:hypothetical protein